MLPVIEDGAWIGQRAIILPGRRIGRGAVVAAGAVVTRDVAPLEIVAGNPARVIGSRETVYPSRQK
jgi:acetyltransferase-like isoleucine patch superfamily enzyme